jgi:hypothetical protein
MIAVPAEAVRGALLECIQQFWKLDHNAGLAQARRTLKEKASAVSGEITGGLIDVHPLRQIVAHALNDIVEHSAAVDALGKTRAALLHVRHVEELFTVTKYLISQADRYNEFAWRWNNFKTIHAIRNRILNLKRELDPRMQEWLRGNLANLQAYFHKKFEEDPSKCMGQWEKASNWLYPISLNEVFEKTGRLGSYKSMAYDWNSHTVHFSPLSNVYIGYELEHHDYGDFAIDSVKTCVHKLCSECLPLVAKQDALKDLYFRNLLTEAYGLLCEKPQYYMYLANKSPKYFEFTKAVLQKPHDYETVFRASAGVLPKDPLIIEAGHSDETI